MKNEKVGLSTTELVLSIVGIIVLSCLLILPPLFRVVLKEKTVEEDIPKPMDIKTLTCTKNNYYSQDATIRKNDTYTIKYYKDKVRTYTVRKESIYSDPSPYADEKQKLGKVSTAYNLVDGIDFKLNPNDAGLKLTSEENCDLSIFKSTTVTVPGDTEPTKINAIYTVKDSVEQIKTDLEDEGYKCSE